MTWYTMKRTVLFVECDNCPTQGHVIDPPRTELLQDLFQDWWFAPSLESDIAYCPKCKKELKK